MHKRLYFISHCCSAIVMDMECVHSTLSFKNTHSIVLPCWHVLVETAKVTLPTLLETTPYCIKAGMSVSEECFTVCPCLTGRALRHLGQVGAAPAPESELWRHLLLVFLSSDKFYMASELVHVNYNPNSYSHMQATVTCRLQSHAG